MNKTEILSAVHTALGEKELNFNTKMAETFTLVDGVYIPTGAYTAIRDDKTGPEAVISRTAFTKNYVPIQNEDAFSVLGEMADQADVAFQNIGSWGNGAGIFAQISLGDITGIGSSGDTVGKWLSIVNSHDGSRALQMLVTPYRFFCQNQISKAIPSTRQAGTTGLSQSTTMQGARTGSVRLPRHSSTPNRSTPILQWSTRSWQTPA